MRVSREMGGNFVDEISRPPRKFRETFAKFRLAKNYTHFRYRYRHCVCLGAIAGRSARLSTGRRRSAEAVKRSIAKDGAQTGTRPAGKILGRKSCFRLGLENFARDAAVQRDFCGGGGDFDPSTPQISRNFARCARLANFGEKFPKLSLRPTAPWSERRKEGRPRSGPTALGANRQKRPFVANIYKA